MMMKHLNRFCELALVYAFLCTNHSFSQSAWSHTYSVNGPLAFEIGKPIEINGKYFVLQHLVISQNGINQHKLVVRSFSTNGQLLNVLHSDSIIGIRQERLQSGYLISNNHLASTKLILLVNERSNSSSITYKQFTFNDQFTLESTDSIICFSCFEQAEFYISDALEIQNHSYLLGGPDIRDQRPDCGVLLLDFNNNAIVFRSFDELEYGGYVLFSPFKLQSGSDEVWGFNGVLESQDRLLLDDQLDFNTALRNTLGQNVPGNFLSSQTLISDTNSIISAGIFRDFSFSDTGRVGLALQLSDGFFCDSVTFPSSVNKWYDRALLSTFNGRNFYVAGSQYTTQFPALFSGAIDIHKVNSQFNRVWSISLGVKPGYAIAQLTATSDGGVLLVNRFFDNGQYFHEIVKIDSLGNTVSIVEFDRPNTPFTLYPNPAGERVFVQMKAPNEGSMRYSLQSTSGQLIQSEAYHPEEGIDLSTLASGVYHLMLWKNGQPIGAERLVVE